MAYRHAVLLGNVNSLQLSIELSEVSGVSNYLEKAKYTGRRFAIWLLVNLSTAFFGCRTNMAATIPGFLIKLSSINEP